MSNLDFVKQIAAYVPSVLIPGVINFLALAIYTRLLSAEEYGKYIFTLVLITNLKIIGFEWIKLGIFRFYNRESENRCLPIFLKTIVIILGFVSLFIVFFWIISLYFIEAGSFRRLAVLGLLFLFGYSFFDIVLQLNRAAIQSIRYGVLAAIRAITCLGLSVVLLLFFERDASNLLLGMMLGTWAAVGVDLPRWTRKMTIGTFSKPMAAELLRYGIPLALLAIVSLMTLSSDRFIISYFLNSQALGLYAAGCDLTDQSITMVFMVLNLAIYPLILKSAEQSDKALFVQQMSDYLIYLLGITAPIVGLIVVCSGGFANVALGESFRGPAAEVIPWIALATFLRGIKSYFLDLVFQIGLRTDLQLLSTLPAAVANIALNLLFIPNFGIMGAAYASVLSQGFALMISFCVGRKVFLLRLPASDCFKILISTGVMIIGVHVLPGDARLVDLIFKLAAGLTIYGILAWCLKIEFLRNLFKALSPNR